MKIKFELVVRLLTALDLRLILVLLQAFLIAIVEKDLADSRARHFNYLVQDILTQFSQCLVRLTTNLI